MSLRIVACRYSLKASASSGGIPAAPVCDACEAKVAAGIIGTVTASANKPTRNRLITYPPLFGMMVGPPIGPRDIRHVRPAQHSGTNDSWTEYVNLASRSRRHF